MKQSKPKGLREKIVHLGVFDFSVVCVVGKYENLGKYLRWKFEDNSLDLDDFYDGYKPRGKCCFCRGYVPVVWIPRLPQTPREHATLAHECLHAVYHLFDWASLPLTSDTEEVMTHSMGYLISEFTKW